MSGIQAAGIYLKGEDLVGASFGGAYLHAYNTRGINISAYNDIDGHSEGISVGLLNVTESLKGVQLGVLNIVWDNPRGRRFLPLINWGSD
jgi:hypothetical protein